MLAMDFFTALIYDFFNQKCSNLLKKTNGERVNLYHNKYLVVLSGNISN